MNEAIELALQFQSSAGGQPARTGVRRRRRSSGARPNPEIQALIGTPGESRTTTLQLAQPIELGGKRSARVAVAELGQAQASVDIQARRSQVRADVAEAFYNAAIAQGGFRLAQTSADLAGRAADAVTKRVTAGKVSPVEETRVNVARAGVRVELLQAEGELRSSRQRLALLLGPAAPVPKHWTGGRIPARCRFRPCPPPTHLLHRKTFQHFAWPAWRWTVARPWWIWNVRGASPT